MTDSDDKILEELPPERFLDTSNARLIKAGLHCMHFRETVQQYLAYENQHEIRGLKKSRKTVVREGQQSGSERSRNIGTEVGAVSPSRAGR